MASGRGPLVGREAELATLREVAARAADTGPAGVVLVGEAGVGKTRLATELCREIERAGGVVAVSHGVHLSGGELPYAGIAEFVRTLTDAVGVAQLRRVAGRDLRGLAAFEPGFGGPEDGGIDRVAVASALLAVVEGVARQRTLVWLLDDLPWLDAPSQDFAGYLARVVRRARLLLVATVRDTVAEYDDGRLVDLLRAPGISTLQVHALARDGVEAQARSLSSRPLDAAELDRIRRLSDGIPFFVEELVAADGDLPPTLRRAMTMSTRDLADDARLLLRAVALDETLATPETLAQVVGLPDARVESALKGVRGRDILRPDHDGGSLRFRHALLREAVEAEMLAGERRALHRRWAEVLTSPDRASTDLTIPRARHWYLAGDPATAHPHVLAAARFVEGLEDHAARSLWWGRALETWPEKGGSDPSRDRALYNLLLARVAVGEARQALELLRPELGDRSTDRVRELWLLLMWRHLARIAGELDNAPPAPQDADALFAWLRTLGPDFRVNSVLHFLLHEWDGSRRDLYLPICDELARRGDADDDVDDWYLALRHRGWWQQAQGDFDGQLETARSARDVVLARMPSRRLEAEWDWCWGLEEAGRYADAVDATDRALALIEEPRAVLQFWAVLVGCRAAAATALGDWDSAKALLTRMHDEIGHSAVDPAAVLGAELRGAIAARTGDVAVAHQDLETIGAVPADPAAPWYVLPLAALRAEVALATDDDELAESAITALEDVQHAVGAPDAIVQGLLGLARHADRPASGLLDRVARVADRHMPTGGRVQDVVRAEIAQHERRLAGADTGDGWESVVAGWEALGRVFDVAWCRNLQSAAAARTGHRAAAATALAEAWAIADRLGAEPLRARVAATARRFRLPLEGVRSTAVGNLTERETEVLRLVADGRTNAQIAEDLVISPKTASVHVSRILTKLGASNRTEAAAVARRLGLD